jgi:hypothetical protein
MDMNEHCPVCKQAFGIEPALYYGTNMIRHSLALLMTAISFLPWIMVIGISLHDNRLFWCIGPNAILLILLQPFPMRLSRTV